MEVKKGALPAYGEHPLAKSPCRKTGSAVAPIIIELRVKGKSFSGFPGLPDLPSGKTVPLRTGKAAFGRLPSPKDNETMIKRGALNPSGKSYSLTGQKRSPDRALNFEKWTGLASTDLSIARNPPEAG